MRTEREESQSQEIAALFRELRLDDYDTREGFQQLAKLGGWPLAMQIKKAILDTRGNTAEEEENSYA